MQKIFSGLGMVIAYTTLLFATVGNRKPNNKKGDGKMPKEKQKDSKGKKAVKDSKCSKSGCPKR